MATFVPQDPFQWKRDERAILTLKEAVVTKAQQSFDQARYVYSQSSTPQSLKPNSSMLETFRDTNENLRQELRQDEAAQGSTVARAAHDATTLLDKECDACWREMEVEKTSLLVSM